MFWAAIKAAPTRYVQATPHVLRRVRFAYAIRPGALSMSEEASEDASSTHPDFDFLDCETGTASTRRPSAAIRSAAAGQTGARYRKCSRAAGAALNCTDNNAEGPQQKQV